MVTETKNSNVPHETLRRLAQRVPEVIERHSASDPMLAELASTLGPTAAQYMEAFDALHACSSRRKAAAVREDASIQRLNERCLGWVQVIARDAPRFDPAEYSVRSAVPHDAIANARKLVAFIHGYPETEPALSYADQILSELTELIPAAQQDANAVKAVLVTQQELQNKAREAAAELYRQLLLFRRVLRRLLGASHRDYRLLALERPATAARENEQPALTAPQATSGAQPTSTNAPPAAANGPTTLTNFPSMLNAPLA